MKTANCPKCGVLCNLKEEDWDETWNELSQTYREYNIYKFECTCGVKFKFKRNCDEED